MRELLPDLANWIASDDEVALATVISTWGSAPRRPGAYMAINRSGDIVGSVSGGCVEGAVVDAALKTLESGQAQLLHFGVADETAWDVGLACGGEIEVFVQPVAGELLSKAISKLQQQEAFVLSAVLQGPEAIQGSLSLLPANEGLTAPKRDLRQDVEHFLNPILPAPQLVMVGGVHIAVALAEIAKTLDFATIIVDPRRAFANPERFERVDQLIQEWPAKALAEIKMGPSTALASLSHDPKIDDPALIAGLDSQAFYVGALGSNKSHARRLERLREAGIAEEDLARIRGPIGLDIGAQTPEEIALAIMGEVVSLYRAN